MIIFIPDPCPNAEGKLVSFAHRGLNVSDTQRHLMIDIGLSIAIAGVSIGKYVKLVQKAVQAHSWDSIRIVVPDAFDNWPKTVELWRRYAPVLKRYGQLMFVAQELIPPPADLDPPPDIVALPARRQGCCDCAHEPLRCAQRIGGFLWLYRDRYRIHLLGPALRTLRFLNRWGDTKLIESFDTASYRRAPTKADKQENGGAWQIRTTMQACKWLESWLKLMYD